MVWGKDKDISLKLPLPEGLDDSALVVTLGSLTIE